MRKRDVRTFLMVAVLIFLSLLALWVASFSLDRSEERGVQSRGRADLRLPLTAFLAPKEGSGSEDAEGARAPAEDSSPAVAEGPPPFEPFWHVVESGDTLERLSIRYYDSLALWRRIHRANLLTIPDPNRLKVGTRLFVPDPEGPDVTAEEFARMEEAASEKPLRVIDPEERSLEYVVQPGDTLYDIAEMLYDSPNAWRRLYQLNSAVIDDPNKLKPGTRLYVP